MSSQFPRIGNDPAAFVPPQTNTTNDPFASIPGKLGEFLRGGGQLDTTIRRQMEGSRYLQDDMEALADSDQYDWSQGGKLGGEKTWDFGATDKPKDGRLKEDKTEVAGKDSTEPHTLRKMMDDEKARQQKESAFNDKPYDKQKYYDKNSQHLDGGKATDWLNQKAYGTKLREQQAEAGKEAGKSGSDKRGAEGSKSGLFKDRVDDTDVKRGGITAETHYGSFTPTLLEGSLSSNKVTRDSTHTGYENVNRLGEGTGYTQTNAGTWGTRESAKGGRTFDGGMGARAEGVNTYSTGNGGELTVRGTALAGAEGSVGGKFGVGPLETTIQGGAEARVGLFGEAGVTYQPVEWKPTVFGAPIDLSPQVDVTTRTFTGAEVGAGGKMGWRLLPDPAGGKMSPEMGAEGKAAAFAGGKAEAEGMVGAADVGKAGGSVAGLYGIGAEGKAALGLNKDEKGRTRLKGELKLGASLGIGLTLGVKFDINVDGISRFGSNVIQKSKQFFNKVGNAVKDAPEKVAQAFDEAADKVKGAAKDALKGIKKFFGF